ncbi:anaerobic ribonucleotide reductase-activating protein [compost metagenome]
MWTGYKLDELNDAQMEIVDLINVLVDGKFVQDLKDPALIWRGSSNQVVHHLR